MGVTGNTVVRGPDPENMEADDAPLPRDREQALRLGIVCSFFPSRIQPWLITSTEQALLRGAQVRVYASHATDAPPPRKALALGLLENTDYLPATPFAGLAKLWSVAHGSGRPAHRAPGLFSLLRILAHGAGQLARPKDFLRLISMAPALGEPVPDLVHCHSLTPAYRFLPALEYLGCPMVYTFHGVPPEGVSILAPDRRARVFAATSRVIVNTRYAAEQVCELGCPKEKIAFLPQGVLLDEFPFVPRVSAHGRPLELISIGRLQADKGYPHALNALAALKAEGMELRYRIIGVGDEQASLEGLTRELGLEDCVEFVGTVAPEDIPGQLARADILLLPSCEDNRGIIVETQGVVIQEAQATGTLIVASRTGGIPECVADGTGILVPPKDPAAIARAINELWLNREQWPQIRQRARDHVERQYDASVLGDRLWSLYQDVLQEHGRAGTFG